ncbi:alpha/beta fold hydrolase [Ktedonosporobacter rubrisoli]|uniref:Alpha/beta fold hydrolase n=1 Tax=Ktedonosporobacter rubrisoli TaxID=2509675 RepID=A0A4P6JLB2_KTERU|nr:alpha/beta hydrolase [Ktedonosporobacter rubrisoli]QBD75446.1 alpha/beta fold hydrolase [Ktedonosporobacter rubrisoli]
MGRREDTSQAFPHFIESGQQDNQTVVLLHGLGMGYRFWELQLPFLSKRYHLLALDLPGFAGSVSSGPFTMIRAAAATVDLLDKQAIPAAHLCGLSLGAMVALQIAIQSPGHVLSLILSAGQIQPDAQIMEEQFAAMAAVPEDVLFESFINFVPPQYEDLRQAAREDLQQTGKQGLLAAMREASQVRFRQHLRQIRVPSLILCGSEDLVNLEAAQELAETLPHAQLAIIAGVGHAWNLEKPDEFARMVDDFVQQVEHKYKDQRT